jgi:opacity protein-like surface antigen
MVKHLVVALAAIAFTTTAQAQDSTKAMAPGSTASGGFTVTLGGGAMFPVGDTQDGLKTGWSALGGIGFNLPWVPFGLRADAAFNRADTKGFDGNGQIFTAGLDGIAQFPLHAAGFVPYFIGGVGYGHVKAEAQETIDETTVTASQSQNKFMWNAGLGVKWSVTHFDMFVEGKYTSVLTDDNFGGKTEYIPVVVGITLRP